MTTTNLATHLASVVTTLLANDIQFMMSSRPVDQWAEICAFGDDAHNLNRLYPDAVLDEDDQADEENRWYAKLVIGADTIPDADEFLPFVSQLCANPWPPREVATAGGRS